MQPPKLITLEQTNWLAINSPEHQGTGDSKCYNSSPASEQTPPRCNFQDKDLIPELHQQRRYLEDLTTHNKEHVNVTNVYRVYRTPQFQLAPVKTGRGSFIFQELRHPPPKSMGQFTSWPKMHGEAAGFVEDDMHNLKGTSMN